jgi:hypothetical protein
VPVLLALVIALATAPVPQPTATNPFTLDPAQQATPYPVIGTSKSRALCTSMRRAVAPAIEAAMAADKLYAGFRKQMADYTIRGTDTSRDMMIVQMDRSVQLMVKNTEALEEALQSHNFDAPPNGTTQDAAVLNAEKITLQGVLNAQKVELDAMSGFTETERMQRFGTLNETEQQMAGTLGLPSTAPQPGSITQNPSQPVDSSRAFLQDTNDIFKSKNARISIDQARLIDHDLAILAEQTARKEDAATKVIVPATALCK